MSFVEILLLSIALSIDACVVSFSYGLMFSQERFRNSLLLALFTGIFQGIMPAIGYFLTNFVKLYIQPYAKFIVFVIFAYLGFKFILEALEKNNNKVLCIDLKCLLGIGFATSIDAFSAGISLSLYGNSILGPALLIAVITFLNSNIGFWVGGKLKHLPTKILEIIAGVLLISLGVNALL